MKYYYLKTKVSLGDTIDFNGLKVEVTMNLVKANPELFVVEEELLPEYMECIKTVCDNYTLGKIYKIIDYNNFPKQISIIGDNNYRNDIYCWEEGYLSCSNNCFKPSIKEAFQRQELLEEAKRRYPVGTRFKGMFTDSVYISEDKFVLKEMNIACTCDGRDIIIFDAGNNKWAVILAHLFQTEGGVDIFEGDEYWYVQTGEYETSVVRNKFPWKAKRCNPSTDMIDLKNPNIKRFSTKQAAESWLETNKHRDLQYYEDLLLVPSEIIGGTKDYQNGAWKEEHYTWLKKYEPHLYWQKVLFLIQQDLDEGWKPNWNNEREHRYYIYYWTKAGLYERGSNNSINTGVVYFKSKKTAKKALELLGDNLKFIYHG